MYAVGVLTSEDEAIAAAERKLCFILAGNQRYNRWQFSSKDWIRYTQMRLPLYEFDNFSHVGDVFQIRNELYDPFHVRWG